MSGMTFARQLRTTTRPVSVAAVLRLAAAALVAVVLYAPPAGAASASGRASAIAATSGVTVTYTACPGYPNAAGCFDRDTDTIYVAQRGDNSTLWHELGHVFDRDLLTDSDRRWIARMVGMPRRAWFAAEGRESPAERFADVYAECKMGTRSRPGRMRLTGYGFVIAGGATGRYRRICVAISVLELVR